MRTFFRVITSINICFQIVYMTFGSWIGIKRTFWGFVFYIFRPEYSLVSGLISFFVACGTLILIIKSIKKIRYGDIIMLILNIEHIIYYLNMIGKQ